VALVGQELIPRLEAQLDPPAAGLREIKPNRDRAVSRQRGLDTRERLLRISLAVLRVCALNDWLIPVQVVLPVEAFKVGAEHLSRRASDLREEVSR